MSIKRLIVIVGPTGCGKTALSIRLAEYFHVPILSTDSRQFYRGLAIGTAQPAAEELQRAEHHFIADRAITDEVNCGRYEVMALERLETLFQRHDTVIAVGGSGLYVRALCEGMDDLPEADEQLRTALAARLAQEGLPALCEELARLDPVYHAQVDRSNPARVMRALEVCLQTGAPYSTLRTGARRARPFLILKIGVDLPREVLYERIDQRVELMMQEGLEEEARAVYPYRELNALQTVGYKELFAYFDGTCSLNEAVALIQRNSRRYAKRQLTWFRRDAEVVWFRPDADSEIIHYVESCEY
ncbi:MAG: tRNA (adenosine(37)-N6)-dimethylallyltransferase MiaA [Alistipes sp.]|nr:tRNA (adenosine(37)-N6)-dimethylallyltransferase MiaA [Alistipes sp.]